MKWSSHISLLRILKIIFHNSLRNHVYRADLLTCELVLRSLPAVTLSLEIECFHKYIGRFPMLFKSWHLKDQHFVLSSNFFPLQGLCLIHLLSSLLPFPLSIDSWSSLFQLSLTADFLLMLPSHCPSTVRLWKNTGLCWHFRVLWFLFSLLISASGICQHNSTKPSLGHLCLHVIGCLSGIWYSSPLCLKSSLIVKVSRECVFHVTIPPDSLLALSSSFLTFSHST